MVIVDTEDNRNSGWAKDKSNFGHRMLAKMGWKEGKGLGKEQHGTSTNLRGVRRSDETLGIGATTDTHGGDGWSQTNQNFHGVLESLRTQHGTTESADNKDSKKREKRSKKRKKEKKTLTLAQNRVSAGHSRKMRDAKDLSNKSQEDMAAIFGVTPQQYQFKPIAAVSNSENSGEKSSSKKDRRNKDKSEDISHTIIPSDEEKKSKKKKRKREEKADKKAKKILSKRAKES